MLDLSPDEARSLELRGSLRDLGPNLPPVDDLIAIAVGQRPDLNAYHLGTARAQAELIQERAERFSNAYFLYTPMVYRDNSQVGLNSATSWGAGLFISAPLFNRNQGNLKRARLNIDQSRIEAAAMEKKVIAEVRQAAQAFDDSYRDAQRLKQVVLPAVHRKSDRTWRRFTSGELGPREFLIIQRRRRFAGSPLQRNARSPSPGCNQAQYCRGAKSAALKCVQSSSKAGQDCLKGPAVEWL